MVYLLRREPSAVWCTHGVVWPDVKYVGRPIRVGISQNSKSGQKDSQVRVWWVLLRLLLLRCNALDEDVGRFFVDLQKKSVCSTRRNRNLGSSGFKQGLVVVDGAYTYVDVCWAGM